jgi:hypothetical protein
MQERLQVNKDELKIKSLPWLKMIREQILINTDTKSQYIKEIALKNVFFLGGNCCQHTFLVYKCQILLGWKRYFFNGFEITEKTLLHCYSELTRWGSTLCHLLKLICFNFKKSRFRVKNKTRKWLTIKLKVWISNTHLNH